MADARAYVRASVGQALSPWRIGEAELMTSELVTNAIQHAGAQDRETIGLDIEVREGSVRVSVADTGGGFDRRERAPGREIGGWGLSIVAELSDRWGIEDEPNRVWFEIDR